MNQSQNWKMILLKIPKSTLIKKIKIIIIEYKILLRIKIVLYIIIKLVYIMFKFIFGIIL